MPKGVYDHNNRANKREEILRACLRIYAFYGFEGATMERMAAAAGASKALILKYFGSKQGLVKAMASLTVRENLEKIQAIDGEPGLTLRQREKAIFPLVRSAREEWCLILGTLLVPNFNFDLRKDIEGYMEAETRAVSAHLREFRTPTKEMAQAFAYSMASMRMGYVVDARPRSYHRAARVQLDLYLRPEEEILRDLAASGSS